MGTNYYVRYEPCPHCGRADESKHIGKSSAGWCFSMHVDPDSGIEDIADWVTEWSKPGATIRDEYGRELTPEEMVNIINRSGWKGTTALLGWDWYEQNHAEPGPNGLARSRIDGRHCVGHGPGCWDYIVGEFS